MGDFTVGIIGCGPKHGVNGHNGWGMANSHARGYAETGKCRFTAFCDLEAERATAFNREYANGDARIFTNYNELLQTKPDFVSIATYPHTHAPIVIAAARAGVRAIHCEKPVAPTWAEAREIRRVCEETGVQLSFNHQRRFGKTFQTARNLVRDGAIGELRRMESACPNLHDWGTHWINMMAFFNNESPAVSVLGQADMRGGHAVYGLLHENVGLSHIVYENGVTGTLFTGSDSEKNLGCALRFHGTTGILELHNPAPHIRITGANAQEMTVDGLHGDRSVEMAIADAVSALEEGRKPLLDVTNAVATSEIIFATYLSALTAAKITLPLVLEEDVIVELSARAA